MDAAEDLAPEVGTAAACRAMGVSRATVYRRQKPRPSAMADRPQRRQPRALADAEPPDAHPHGGHGPLQALGGRGRGLRTGYLGADRFIE